MRNKSTKTDNNKADSILKRISITKGEPSWGHAYSDNRSYSFFFKNDSYINAYKYYEVDKPDKYFIEFTTKSQINGVYLKCTQQRAKKIYDAIVELFKEHGEAPYKDWEY